MRDRQNERERMIKREHRERERETERDDAGTVGDSTSEIAETRQSGVVEPNLMPHTVTSLVAKMNEGSEDQ